MNNTNQHQYIEKRSSILTIRLRLNLIDVCALFVIIWTITPIIGESSIFRGAALIGAIIFLINVFINRDRDLINYVGISMLMLVLLFIIIWVGQGELYFAATRVLNLFFFIMLIIISMYYYKYDIRKFNGFTKLILLVFVLVAVFSIIALQSNPFVLRRASGLTVRTGIERYAGSYGFAYGCVFLESFLVYYLRKGNIKGFLRLVLIIMIALFGFLIIDSGYTTAIALALIGVVAALFVDKNQIKTIFIAVIMGLVLKIVVPKLLTYIVSNFDIPLVYQQKIMLLSDITTSGSNVTYSDSTRGQLLLQSLHAIVKYPVLGSVILAGEAASGGHQTLLDVLANYGVLYAVLYYYVIVYTPFKLMKYDRAIQVLFLIIAVMLGFTNTYDFGTFIIPVFFGPYVATKIYSKNPSSEQERNML